jgi:uncharacterized RDD family membrane protein YckC
VTGHGASALPQGVEAFQGQSAGIVSRAVAAVVDGVVVAVVLLAGYVALCAVVFAWSPRHFEFPAPSGWFTIAAAGAVATTYLTVGWWIAGRSVGCAVLGLRVVDPDGHDLGLLASVVRAVVCVLFPLGLAWCVVDRRARGVADLIVRSHVIYDWRHQEP